MSKSKFKTNLAEYFSIFYNSYRHNEIEERLEPWFGQALRGYLSDRSAESLIENFSTVSCTFTEHPGP